MGDNIDGRTALLVGAGGAGGAGGAYGACGACGAGGAGGFVIETGRMIVTATARFRTRFFVLLVRDRTSSNVSDKLPSEKATSVPECQIGGAIPAAARLVLHKVA